MTALTAEQLALVEAMGDETYDYVKAILADAFMVKYGQVSAVAGDNSIGWTDSTDDPTDNLPYDDTTYIIDVIQAVDADGYDVRGELEILDANKTVNGFVINCLNPCTIKWQTMRKTPKMNFYTD